jgi:hypothetical protein
MPEETNAAVAGETPLPPAGAMQTEGKPNGLAPALPEAPLGLTPATAAHVDWFETHVKNSVHSRDTEHFNKVHALYQALQAELRTKAEA